MNVDEKEFTWLNKQGVSSSHGFKVQMIDRTRITYSEGSKVLTIDVEMGMSGGELCLLYAPSSFQAWDGSDVKLSSSEESRIESNFQRALSFQGVAVLSESAD